MKKLILATFALGVFQLSAQDLPMPSPGAKLEQRVGLTDFTIEYSRPSAKDREIFGSLVPYGQLWRTGANMNSTIEFNSEVHIGGETVEPGKYSLLTIPGEGQWVVILNKKNDMPGTTGYSEDMDVLRTEVSAEETEFVETFTIDINNIRNESASLVLKWANTKVELPMEMEVQEQALANIERAIEEDSDNLGRVYRNAANYYYNNQLDSKQALDYIDKAIAADAQGWYTHWLRAEILADQNNYKEAVNSAEKAIQVGRKDAKTRGNEFGYADMIQTSIKTWKSKSKS